MLLSRPYAIIRILLPTSYQEPLRAIERLHPFTIGERSIQCLTARRSSASARIDPGSIHLDALKFWLVRSAHEYA
jgi:hypothetical protein